jgi:hypothetical protein
VKGVIHLDMDMFLYVVIAVAIIFLVIGLMKRTVWLCVVAAILAIGVGLTQPDVVEKISTSITSLFDGAIEPMEDEDYLDLISDSDTVAK